MKTCKDCGSENVRWENVGLSKTFWRCHECEKKELQKFFGKIKAPKKPQKEVIPDTWIKCMKHGIRFEHPKRQDVKIFGCMRCYIENKYN